MKISIKAIIFLILGLAFTGIAIFANSLGLDPNITWGKGRATVFTLGFFLILYVILYYLYTDKVLDAQRKIQTFIENLPFISPIRQNQDAVYLLKLCRNYLFTLPVVFFVILAYIWLVGNILWAPWHMRKTTNYYQFQAQSFQTGQLYLLIKPPPELLQLSNPYDPAERHGINVPIDISLYKGKFYSYWGPVPAMIICALEPLYHKTISDRDLVFGFTVGIFLCQFLLILIIWDRFFQDLPKWNILMAIVLMGLATPSSWMLSSGKIYEAAIAGGQFFLLSGFLAAFAALDRTSPSNWRLALAGSLWALAVGTRFVLTIPIGFLVLMSMYWIYKASHGLTARLLYKLISLGLPLAIGAIGLGWYNWARFGSITETGFLYALAGPYLQKYSDKLFSPIYILQNLYNYLFVPFSIGPNFPNIQPTLGKLTAIFPFYSLPEIYFTNLITGLLYTVPFVVFGIVPSGQLILKVFEKNSTNKMSQDPDQKLFRWIIICLIGCWLAAFITLLMFFWAATRYMEDFMPALLTLSLIGFWQGYKLLAPRAVMGKVYAIFGIVLAIVSILVSALLAIAGHYVFIR